MRGPELLQVDVRIECLLRQPIDQVSQELCVLVQLCFQELDATVEVVVHVLNMLRL